MSSEPWITPEISIADLLTRYPQAVPVFLNHKMTCIGCDMSVFDTLEEVVLVYGLSLEDFMTEIRAAVTHAARPE